MTKKTKEEEFDFANTGWAFAIINNKLAEFYFDKKKRGSIHSHCYVKLEEYKTKQEQKMIREDIVKYKFTWKKGEYKQVPVAPEAKTKKSKVARKD
ncbi:MAG: hypothetical protein WAV98_02505 [Minisyncoccia bacterium]